MQADTPHVLRSDSIVRSISMSINQAYIQQTLNMAIEMSDIVQNCFSPHVTFPQIVWTTFRRYCVYFNRSFLFFLNFQLEYLLPINNCSENNTIPI